MRKNKNKNENENEKIDIELKLDEVGQKIANALIEEGKRQAWEEFMNSEEARAEREAYYKAYEKPYSRHGKKTVESSADLDFRDANISRSGGLLEDKLIMTPLDFAGYMESAKQEEQDRIVAMFEEQVATLEKMLPESFKSSSVQASVRIKTIRAMIDKIKESNNER